MAGYKGFMLRPAFHMSVISVYLKAPYKMHSDEKLIEAVQAGDAAAFEKLVRRHGDRFFNLGLRLTGNRADAEDILQEAFIRLWRNPFAWKREGGLFTTWFYRVFVNLFLDRRRRFKKTEGDDALADMADESANAEDQLLDNEQDYALIKAVNLLPPQQNVAVQLYYYDGFSQSEAAAVMKMHVKAFESLLYRARQRLKKDLLKKED
jgi:RNA polymerase sigma-70 factor, ECF subfamily